MTRRNEDVHEHAAMERDDIAHARLVAVVASDEAGAAPLEDTDDAAFSASTFFNTFDAHDDAVAVHRFVEKRTGNVDVAAGVERPFWRDKSITGRMRLQPADIQIHLFGQTESMAAKVNELARSDKRLD